MNYREAVWQNPRQSDTLQDTEEEGRGPILSERYLAKWFLLGFLPHFAIFLMEWGLMDHGVKYFFRENWHCMGSKVKVSFISLFHD